MVDKKILDRIKGGIIGFMVGDALGIPVAGLKESEVKKEIGYITHYITNFRHPFFYFLKKGQYGSNSRLLLTALESIIKNKGYNHNDLKKNLKKIASLSEKDHFYSRWLGETIGRALLTGKPTLSSSCTCIYRSIPIALLYNDLEKVLFLSEKQTKITHISSTSLSSSLIISYFLFHLKAHCNNFKKIINEAIDLAEKRYNGKNKLTIRLRKIIEKKISNLAQAKNNFGTGSPSYQLIPIAFYLFLKYPKNFQKTITLAANCYRTDKKKDGDKYLSYCEQLIHCHGGDTNAIAGLVGSFSGCYNGYLNIPRSFLIDLEDKRNIEKTIDRLFFRTTPML